MNEIFYFSPEQLVELAQAYAWPITTIILAFSLRKRLGTLLENFLTKNNVTEFSTAAFTAKFSQTTSATKNQDRATFEISSDYQSVLKYQKENHSKYSLSILRNYRLHRESFKLSDSESIDMIENTLAITVAQNSYTYINIYIYKSQFDFLESIYLSDTMEVKESYLFEYFEKIKSTNNFLQNLTSQQYISFLTGQGLIHSFENILRLSDFGEAYVKYMRQYPNLIGSLNPY